MKVKTKFNIGQVVKHKHQANKDEYVFNEVMEIETVTCYSGTQAFYKCRGIILHKVNKPKWKPDSEEYWEVYHSISNNDGKSIGWNKYREDELMNLTQKEADLLHKAEKIES